MFTVDAHCDSVLHLCDPAFSQSAPPHHIDFERLTALSPGVQWFSCFPLRGHSPYELVSRLLDTLDYEQQRAGVASVTSAASLEALSDGGVSYGVLRAIEGGEALEGKLSRVDEFFARDVRSLGLTWNHPNALSGGCETPEQGLTMFGRNVISRMEELGMVVDLAHISTSGFWDALDCAQKPVAVSHACCAALFGHRRNLSDAQIKALASRGGVVGVCLYPHFLGGGGIDDIIRHMLHLRNVGGRECVGLGSDFDGIETLPSGIDGIQDIPKLWDALQRAGIHTNDIALIAGGNWLRLLKELLP